MVASELPAPTPQIAAASQGAASVAAPVNGDPTAAEGTADFVSVLTQLLGTASAPSNSAGPLQDALSKEGDDGTDGDLSEGDVIDAAAAPVVPTILPVVAEIAQALNNARTIGAGGEQLSARSQEVGAAAANAIVANAQLQAVAISGEARSAMSAAFRTAADAQLQLAQAQQLQITADANANSTFSSDTAGGDGKAGKQDGSAGNWNAAVTLNAAAAQGTATRTELLVQSHVGSAGWRDEVGAKLTWMIDRGIQQGTLRLSPESLGPMEVRITTQNDQVSVWFGAAHADTRAALENALPRLREMFAAQGMSLADAGVFREPPKDTSRAYIAHGADGVSGVDVEQGVTTIGRRNGLLDAYA